MHYYFNDKITTETINDLVEKLSQEDGEINLYFGTQGGETASMKFLINYLNSIKDRVTITVTDRVWSSGVYLLIYFYGKIKIDIEETDSLLFHIGDRQMYLSAVDRDLEDRNILKRQDKEYNQKIAEKIKEKGFLTDKQIKDFLKGKDVVIYKDTFSKWKLD
jgi:ATP-dependent protease ClpP protease subunit